MAAKAQPLKLNYRKPKNPSDKPQATLDIAATSADAALLHYQKDLILERINQLYGEKWVTAIRFVHVAANNGDFGDAGYPLRKAPLSAGDIKAVEDALCGIDDDELRIRLEKLGQSVLRKRHNEIGPSKSQSGYSKREKEI